ncbi:phosphoglycerol transferase MdoB-like AlkP superfamily enzyme [Luteibacter rhizovicinus]|uniref:Phosphoglycerol transferase MdoB-like AlkP superfamily enzyme n=1 Tax=Luteibacter rhizovicinus TaxID=242606 RepID=A0A4R3YKN7_9GAMM|nr:alkaline phosphatase family protein [Luteibacter rhizovicinus]TCV92761.1 phosphoglycerol transferase MdoB-like AlkP superfamily enzyme [Luteibacter rhizovicinus]
MRSHSSVPGALRQRFAPLVWFGVVFVVLAFVTRLVLLIKTGKDVPHDPLQWLYLFGVGLGYDLMTYVYFAWPMLLVLWLLPRRAYLSRIGHAIFLGFCFVLLFAVLYLAASELVFWNEFGARFNFIAVDYLVYTHEVVGNIQESYPIVRWSIYLLIATILIFLFSRRALRARDSGSRFLGRTAVVGVWLVLTVAGSFAIDGSMKDRAQNNYVNELAGNGIYQFFAAFRNNELDYARYYKTIDNDEAFRTLRGLLQTPDSKFVSDDPHNLTRVVTNEGPEKHLNVVLISVESLSGDYMEALAGSTGKHEHLTPNLDTLADKSLFFTQLYANGTRTVRGLEALALSVPPTPGESIVKRPGNEGLFSLADVFNTKGYTSQFLYGGYGYFDNMNHFFSTNGYEAVDRNAIADKDIHAENVWGVADEDLFTLTISQMDKSFAAGKPYFGHVMTTSNHRPFTFPKDRVDMPQGSRRAAVKYTDWAIADFLKRASTKPWFDDTIFIITADHCATSAGKTSLPVDRYHIPLLIYSPKHVQPGRVDRLMSQIDIPPTLLGLLNFSYTTRFFGYDLFKIEPGRERAFISTYQELGYMHGDKLTSLVPRDPVKQVVPNRDTGETTPVEQIDQADANAAVSYYQIAAYLFTNGLMKYDAKAGK